MCGCSVREAQRRFNKRDLCQWRAWRRIERWGQERADLRMGTLAAALLNWLKDLDTRPADFMPYEPAPPVDTELDLERQKAAFRRLKE